MKVKKRMLSIALALLVTAFAAPAYAAPAMPHAFYGTLNINSSPALVGTTVEARGTGVTTGITGNPITTTVQGQYGSSDPAGAKLIVQGSVTSGTTISFYVNGIQAAQTATFTAGAVTNLNLTVTFTAPSVSSAAATGVTSSAATLNGELTSLGTATSVNVSFEYGTTTEYGSSTTAQALTAAANFTAALTGLLPGTTYHYRAKANGGAHGTANGADTSFTTPATPPTVATSAASSIGGTSATINGNLSALGTATTVNVSFEYGTTDTYGNTTTASAMTATGAFSATLTGLTPGTTYHFRARADGGSSGNGTGSDLSFATVASAAPTLSSGNAKNVTATSATLDSSLTSLGSAPSVSVSFEWGLTASYGNTTDPQAKTAAGSFEANITGLTPNTLYHFRAKAVGDTTVFGSDSSFTTPAVGAPVVATDAATGATFTAATLNGTLSSLGAAASVNVSFEYGTTTAYGSATTATAKTAAAAFGAALTGLAPGTTYHFRAKADGGSNGTSFGNDATFATTAVTAPGGVTVAASSIGTGSAVLNGNLTAMGTASSVALSFQYGTATNYGSTVSAGTKTATGTFSATVTGLQASTLYHFRVVADAGVHGGYNGADMTFTTAAAAVTGSGGGSTGGSGGGPALTLSGLSGSLPVAPSGHTMAAATLSTSDGKVKLDIAFSTQMLGANGQPIASLTAAPIASPPAPPSGKAIVIAYDFGPDGATFSTPIKLSLTYTLPLPAGMTEDSMAVAWYDGSKWVELGGTVDKVNKTVTIELTHFSKYALIGKATTAAPTTPTTPTTPTMPTTPTTPTTPAKPVAPTTPTEPTTPTAPTTPAVTQPTTPAPPSQPAIPQQQTNWGLIAGIIAAVIVVAVVVYFVRRRTAS